jgi:A/G-specific adenine glycosylase
VRDTEAARDLLKWYDANRRDLPWRRTSDPYAIWISEVMLQQTQVETVLPYYVRWMTALPTVGALATADEQEVLSLWQGLGYYRRARLLRKGAEWIVTNGMPIELASWRRVPGVGPYTAAAVSSIAFGYSAAVVDGNVERVYARLAADDATGPTLRKAAWTWAERSLNEARPGDWNQALMELGATVCRPVKPQCPLCPLEERCIARQTWRVESFPTPRVRAPVVRLHHAVWIPVWRGRFGVRQIAAGQWWAGMWEFPRAKATDENETLRLLVGPGWVEHVATFRHSVTQHRIRVDVSLVRVEGTTEELRWLTFEELAALPMPSPQRKALRLLAPYVLQSPPASA